MAKEQGGYRSKVRNDLMVERFLVKAALSTEVRLQGPPTQMFGKSFPGQKL